MAVKVGNSWVSEAALAYAKNAVENSGSEKSSVLSDLSEKYKDTNFMASTAPFQGKGTNNISISPNILRQMEQDPEKRLEYEALIYDCVEVQKSGVSKGANVIASGFIINPDGSLGAWSISKSGGEKLRRQTKLDKKDKKSWTEKLHEMQKEKKVRQKEQRKRQGSARDKKSEVAGSTADREGVRVAFSEQGMELAKQRGADSASRDEAKTFKNKKDFWNYLAGKYQSVRNGTVSISGSYLKECMNDAEKQKELFKMLDDAEYMVKDAEENLEGYQGMRIRVDDKGNMETETYGSKVAVNEEKRLRQIASAKTVSDVQMVISLLQKDLSDCQAGLRSGACDENEVKKVKALIAKAQQKMTEVQDGDSDKDEDEVDVFSMNMLM